MKAFLQNLINDTSGVTLVEYGIAIGLAITIGAGAFALLAGEISAGMQAVGVLMPD